MEGYLGEVRAWAASFAPRGWKLCQGQIIPIQSNTALFSVISNKFGGDGTTYFGLPNLMGRMPIGAGQGQGLSPVSLGQMGGAEGVALSVNQMPAHTHAASLTFEPQCSTGNGNQNNPAASVYSQADILGAIYGEEADSTMGVSDINMNMDLVGKGQPHENMLPFQVVNFIICTEGLMPDFS